MSNCRITPVLVLVLVFSFMFGGCGRDVDLRELSQEQVPAGAGEEDAAGEGAAGEAEAFPGAGGSGGEDVSGEAECVIHICGAVAVPGVYRLPAGSRVVDAVEAAGGLADINTADAAELMTLPGIGQTRADAIVAYRQQNGKFQSIEDIMKVDGIKEGSFAKLKDRICVRQ